MCSLSPQAYPYEWFSYSSFGGNWGPTLKYAGYDAIVVQGQSARPVYLWVNDGKVELRDASELWGQGIYATQETLLRRHGKDVRVVAIGQAGENRSRIAIIASGTSSAAGQGGFGAVMGAKGLKAIAVRGTGGVPLADPGGVFGLDPGGRQGDARAERLPEMEQPGSRIWWPTTASASTRAPSSAPTRSAGSAATTTTCPAWSILNRKYSGTITCESSLFGGAPGTIYNWKIGFQGGFELARISQDYGLNHWELGIGMAPWLRKCHAAGQLKSLDGEPFDLDQASCWDTLFRKIVFREGIGDALAEGTVRAAEILGMGQEFVADFYTAWGFAGHWDGHGDKINLIVFPYWLVPALQWATAPAIRWPAGTATPRTS